MKKKYFLLLIILLIFPLVVKADNKGCLGNYSYTNQGTCRYRQEATKNELGDYICSNDAIQDGKWCYYLTLPNYNYIEGAECENAGFELKNGVCIKKISEVLYGNDCQNGTLAGKYCYEIEKAVILNENEPPINENGCPNGYSLKENLCVMSYLSNNNSCPNDAILDDDYCFYITYPNYEINNGICSGLYELKGNVCVKKSGIVQQSGGVAYCIAGYALRKTCYDIKKPFSFQNGENNISEKIECEALLGLPTEKGSPAWYLSFIFKVLRYIAIIILIVLTIMDFVGAVASHDNDILKKAVGKATKRMILCVIIFLLPTLIEFILQIIAEKEIELCINTNRNG